VVAWRRRERERTCWAVRHKSVPHFHTTLDQSSGRRTVTVYGERRMAESARADLSEKSRYVHDITVPTSTTSTASTASTATENGGNKRATVQRVRRERVVPLVLVEMTVEEVQRRFNLTGVDVDLVLTSSSSRGLDARPINIERFKAYHEVSTEIRDDFNRRLR